MILIGANINIKTQEFYFFIGQFSPCTQVASVFLLLRIKKE